MPNKKLLEQQQPGINTPTELRDIIKFPILIFHAYVNAWIFVEIWSDCQIWQNIIYMVDMISSTDSWADWLTKTDR